MNLEKQKLIDTGKWVAACRAAREDISFDRYAKIWITPELEVLYKSYLEKVSKYEDRAVSLRFRYIYDLAYTFTKKHSNAVIINVAF